MSKKYIIQTNKCYSLKSKLIKNNKINKINASELDFIYDEKKEEIYSVIPFTPVSGSENWNNSSDFTEQNYDIQTLNKPVSNSESMQTHIMKNIRFEITFKTDIEINNIKPCFDYNDNYYTNEKQNGNTTVDTYLKNYFSEISIKEVSNEEFNNIYNSNKYDDVILKNDVYTIISKTSDIITMKFSLNYYLYDYSKYLNSNLERTTDLKKNDLKLYLKYNDKIIEENEISFGNGQNNYQIYRNTFMNTNTMYNNKNILEYNAQQILNNYKNGKNIIEFEMIVCDLYDENNNLIISKELGQIPEIGDIIIFYDTKHNEYLYDSKEYKISQVEFLYNGVPKLNIKCKEV